MICFILWFLILILPSRRRASFQRVIGVEDNNETANDSNLNNSTDDTSNLDTDNNTANPNSQCNSCTTLALPALPLLPPRPPKPTSIEDGVLLKVLPDYGEVQALLYLYVCICIYDIQLEN